MAQRKAKPVAKKSPRKTPVKAAKPAAKKSAAENAPKPVAKKAAPDPDRGTLLSRMLADATAKLHAIGAMVLEMQAHGDLKDEHVELAKAARKLAKRAHVDAKTAVKGE